ncbi:uncharacterized protein LOC118348984 [Juglans regia]|uniref:Uncharacterized protein LOC118348984 n=1 Tax=Juglans regia TaxID=51240 RepID=A0A6P9EUU0_JUGRE|nr:uncharacterized protein LOC118348984 [Juglans regia]XP_035547633.1 uncharacterized protein LOC118348984 [Juglans regia]
MELVRVLPSAEDEVNVACFHPSVGGALIYGTKEGKLIGILQHDCSHTTNCAASRFLAEKNAQGNNEAARIGDGLQLQILSHSELIHSLGRSELVFLLFFEFV